MDDQTASPAFVGLTDGHFLDLAAAATHLRGVRRVDADDPTASLRRFAVEDVQELPPAHVQDALGQAGAGHGFDAQVLVVDDIVGLQKFAGGFVVEVFSLVSHLAVQALEGGDGFFPAAPAPFITRRASSSFLPTRRSAFL